MIGLPILNDWTGYITARYGGLGSGRAWPLANGQAEIEPLTHGPRFVIGDLEDPDSEYSDEDVELEEVGGDWWQTEAVPSMWRLVERHLTNFGYDGKPRPKRLWVDPVVATIGMGNLNTLERIYVA